MKLVYDLDGTTHDSFPAIFSIERTLRKEFGYPPIEPAVYRRKFQTNDWNRFYMDLGIKEQDLESYIQLFVEKFAQMPPPRIIPGAKNAIDRSIDKLGLANVYIVTNEPKERVRVRFKRDGLSYLLENVRNPFEGKAKELFELAIDTEKLAYVGDLVSDGESCKKARDMGAANILFYGITHPQAMNPRDIMLAFIALHPDFARELKNLGEIERTWDQQ